MHGLKLSISHAIGHRF